MPRLMRCGSLACTGRHFTEHRNVPDLRSDPSARPIGLVLGMANGFVIA